jgi:hypothetical protein
MSDTDPRAELREKVFWHIRDSHDAPTKMRRYTRIEPATNLIMSLIDSYVAERERAARIDELQHCCDECGFWHDAHTTKGKAQTFDERLAELNQPLDQKERE